MTDAAKVAALREALGESARYAHALATRSDPSEPFEACENPHCVRAHAALSASDSGEVAGLRAALDEIDHQTTVPPRDRLSQYRRGWAEGHAAAARIIRAALTRPVSETPEAAPSSETRRVLERLDRGVTRATRHTDGMVAARTMHLLIAELLREGASDD